MGRVTIVVKNYSFNKPQILSETEFKSFKQIFQIEPTFNMSPPKSFWDEFILEKWLLIGFFGGILLSLIWDSLSFIFGISFLLIVFAMLCGSAQSMWNYQSFLNEKNRYYENLKHAVINSDNYEEFKQKASRL